MGFNSGFKGLIKELISHVHLRVNKSPPLGKLLSGLLQNALWLFVTSEQLSGQVVNSSQIPQDEGPPVGCSLLSVQHIHKYPPHKRTYFIRSLDHSHKHNLWASPKTTNKSRYVFRSRTGPLSERQPCYQGSMYSVQLYCITLTTATRLH